MSEEVKDRRTLEESEAEMIKVTDEYLIAVDPYNFIARRKGIQKPLGYFGDMPKALTCIYDDMVRRELRDNARNILDVVETIIRVSGKFKLMLRERFPEYEVVKH